MKTHMSCDPPNIHPSMVITPPNTLYWVFYAILLGVLRDFQDTAAIPSAIPSIPVVGSGESWLQELAIPAAA